MEARPTTYNLLFVCTGNTCRSPMAEAIARRMTEERGWTHVAVRSAGVAAEQAGASTQAIEVAAEAGLDLTGHQPRQLDEEVVAWADLILTMSSPHRRVVEAMGGEERVALVTDFVDGDDEGSRGIEDPYGSNLDNYRLAFRQLERAVEGVLSRLEPILSP